MLRHFSPKSEIDNLSENLLLIVAGATTSYLFARRVEDYVKNNPGFLSRKIKLFFWAFMIIAVKFFGGFFLPLALLTMLSN